LINDRPLDTMFSAAARCSDGSKQRRILPLDENEQAPAGLLRGHPAKFQRHKSMKAGAFGFADHAHSAIAEFFQDAVVRNEGESAIGAILGCEPNQVNAIGKRRQCVLHDRIATQRSLNRNACCACD
jgi:hypothetical protein